MEPVRIEFLMVDKLSARLDKAVNKMEELSGKTSNADKQMKELDKSGLLFSSLFPLGFFSFRLSVD